MESVEYSATEIRKILQQLFPHRRLVLSQFTFFNHAGVAKATGETFRRGRRCYRLEDILPIACILALKEEGIPYKNVESLPALLQENSKRIFSTGDGTLLSGYGEAIAIQFPEEAGEIKEPLERFLAGEGDPALFWSFNVGLLALQLVEVAERIDEQPLAAIAQAA